MYRRYYDGYGENELLNREMALNSPAVITSDIEPDAGDIDKSNDLSNIEISAKSLGNSGILSSLYIDDLLLLGVLLILLSQDCDDKLILIIIGFVFISEFLR